MARIHASYYDYSPSQPAAGVFAALFGLAFLVTLFQAIRTRAWIWLVMVFAIASEFVDAGVNPPWRCSSLILPPSYGSGDSRLRCSSRLRW